MKTSVRLVTATFRAVTAIPTITSTAPVQIAGRGIRGSKGGRPPKFDKGIYKDRNTVERAINRQCGYRAVATR